MANTGIAAPDCVRKETALENGTNRIHNVISNIEGQLDRAENAVSRLLNPRPDNVPKDPSPEEEPHSHEAQLVAIARRLDRILSCTSVLATKLNEAI